MMGNKIDITPQTKVGALLDAYPELEAELIAMAPAFKKLKNPILRKTIGRLASLQQAAATGSIPVMKLVNQLRFLKGLPPMETEELGDQYGGIKPEWMEQSKQIHDFDARPILDRGENPMPMILEQAHHLNDETILRLISGFLPVPIIDKLRESGFESWTTKQEDGTHYSYFHKKNRTSCLN